MRPVQTGILVCCAGWLWLSEKTKKCNSFVLPLAFAVLQTRKCRKIHRSLSSETRKCRKIRRSTRKCRKIRRSLWSETRKWRPLPGVSPTTAKQWFVLNKIVVLESLVFEACSNWNPGMLRWLALAVWKYEKVQKSHVPTRFCCFADAKVL